MVLNTCIVDRKDGFKLSLRNSSLWNTHEQQCSLLCKPNLEIANVLIRFILTTPCVVCEKRELYLKYWYSVKFHCVSEN